MKTHTPAPWYVSATTSQGLIISETTGESIAVSYDPKNMHLIAAAPDLLAWLEILTDRLDTVLRYHGGTSDQIATHTELLRANAAIAQAKGEK